MLCGVTEPCIIKRLGDDEIIYTSSSFCKYFYIKMQKKKKMNEQLLDLLYLKKKKTIIGPYLFTFSLWVIGMWKCNNSKVIFLVASRKDANDIFSFFLSSRLPPTILHFFFLK